MKLILLRLFRLFTPIILLSAVPALSFAQAPGQVGWYNGDWRSGVPGHANWYSSGGDYSRV
jgi:hypothetical protein